MHVTFDESYPRNVRKGISFHDAGVSSEEILKDAEEGIDQPEAVIPEKEDDNNYEKEKEDSPTKVDDLPLTWRNSKDHPIYNILGNITKGVTTHSKISNFCYHFAFMSQVEPKNAKETLIDEHWLMAMQDELNKFKRNNVWNLVPPPRYHHIIGTK